MARGTYEQAPVAKKSNESVRTITISRSGDEGVDAELIEKYESYGFTHATTSKTGQVTMTSPREVQEAREQAAIAEHHRRANIRGATPLPQGATMVTDQLTRMNQPVTADQLANDMKLPDFTGQVDDDEL